MTGGTTGGATAAGRVPLHETPLADNKDLPRIPVFKNHGGVITYFDWFCKVEGAVGTALPGVVELLEWSTDQKEVVDLSEMRFKFPTYEELGLKTWGHELAALGSLTEDNALAIIRGAKRHAGFVPWRRLQRRLDPRNMTN